MNPLWRKNPRRVELAEPPAERLDPPGLIYTDKDKAARALDEQIDHGARIARLEQQVRDHIGEHDRLRVRVSELETRIHDMEQMGGAR